MSAIPILPHSEECIVNLCAHGRRDLVDRFISHAHKFGVKLVGPTAPVSALFHPQDPEVFARYFANLQSLEHAARRQNPTNN